MECQASIALEKGSIEAMKESKSNNRPAELPIMAMLPELKQALRDRPVAVLAAPPGAGKTTQVPLALMGEPWLEGRKIIMLEPRRLAARTAARYMAQTLGESVGGRVGYRVRGDARVGPSTVIEVVTEGILTRLLQSDPALEEYGIVLFDEYHERSLQADLGLALCLQSQQLLRPDLRLLVMSATLDTGAVSRLLGDAPIVESAGRSYPVTTHYLSLPANGPMESLVARQTIEALRAHAEGDVLVFLPGVPEIRRVRERLAGPELAGVHVTMLHGNLPLEVQDEAVKRHPAGKRKIILATSIAESSVTVEGVRIVVDSGWSRSSLFSPRTGMSRLETTRVALASADQRRGRAGRLGPGQCYRLWTEEEERQLAPAIEPAIRQTELASVALELIAWGVRDPSELSWLDAPPEAAYRQALELLRQLGAVDAAGQLTAHGRRMSELPLHPRLAHMLLAADSLGYGEHGAVLAALLQERELLRPLPGATLSADLWLRVQAIEGKAIAGCEIDEAIVQRVRQEVGRLCREAGIAMGRRPAWEERICGMLAAIAYPDRVGQRRSQGGYLLSSGRGAALARIEPLAQASYLAAVHLDDQGSESRILLAAAVAETDMTEVFGDRMVREESYIWQEEQQSVRAIERRMLGAIVWQEKPLQQPDPARYAEVMSRAVQRHGLDWLPWKKAHRQLLQRMQFMSRHAPDWPDVTEAHLLDTVEAWLLPHLYGKRSRAELQSLALGSILEGMLDWSQRTALQEEAPTHVRVPSGSSIPVDYSDLDAPAIFVRLQETFGWLRTPTLCHGKIPLTLHLLSPAHRPVQVTRDLESFWKEAYFEIKKDLKGRYPKHYWPDDPLSATATHRAKPRS